jgi:hypothetical protein
MQCRHRRHVQQSQQRVAEVIQMRVDHVEFVRAARHHLQLHEHRCEKILHIWIEAQCARPDGRESGLRQAVARGEQRHLVSEFHQCVCQISDDTFGAAVQFWWDRLGERGNLRNLHDESP